MLLGNAEETLVGFWRGMVVGRATDRDVEVALCDGAGGLAAWVEGELGGEEEEAEDRGPLVLAAARLLLESTAWLASDELVDLGVALFGGEVVEAGLVERANEAALEAAAAIAPAPGGSAPKKRKGRRMRSKAGGGSGAAASTSTETLSLEGARVVLREVKRAPVILILDDAVQVLPLESMPIIRRAPVARAPSLAFVLARCGAEAAVAAAAAAAEEEATSRATTRRSSRSKRKKKGEKKKREASVAVGAGAVRPGSVFYVLNPGGDLVKTQEAFEEDFAFLAAEDGWQGVVGTAPSAEAMEAGLTGHDLMIYCGHSGGQQYLPADRLPRLDTCASALLMGCSSGALKTQGRHDATGVALLYMQAGAPAVVANLWDVTDRDIDRFTQRVLETWLRIYADDDHDGDGDDDQDGDGDAAPAFASLLAAVGEARTVCRLPYLVGAAPVSYGIPMMAAFGEGGDQ